MSQSILPAIRPQKIHSTALRQASQEQTDGGTSTTTLTAACLSIAARPRSFLNDKLMNVPRGEMTSYEELTITKAITPLDITLFVVLQEEFQTSSPRIQLRHTGRSITGSHRAGNCRMNPILFLVSTEERSTTAVAKGGSVGKRRRTARCYRSFKGAWVSHRSQSTPRTFRVTEKPCWRSIARTLCSVTVNVAGSGYQIST